MSISKSFLLKASSLAVIALMIASPAASYAAGPASGLSLPPAGMGSVDVINYDGGSDTLTVSISGLTFQIPPSLNGGNHQWNHAEFNLAPGTYSYTATFPGNDTTASGSFTITAGKITGVGFYTNLADDTANGDKGRDDNGESGSDRFAEARSGLSESTGENVRESRHDGDDLLVGIFDETAQAAQ
jgi:hypothetical protein